MGNLLDRLINKQCNVICNNVLYQCTILEVTKEWILVETANGQSVLNKKNISNIDLKENIINNEETTQEVIE